MPNIAELKEMDGALWARVPLLDRDGRIQLLSDAEIATNERRMSELLAEIERLRAALKKLTNPLSLYVEGHLVGTARALAIINAMKNVASEAIADEQSTPEVDKRTVP